MKILNFEEYLDGGTMEITTDKGVFCFDHRFGTNTEGRLYSGLPKNDYSNLIDDSKDIENDIIEALKDYKDEFYQKTIDDLIKSRDL